jgi:diguanylate cyclase (GGDEF)-like protein
LKKIILPGLLVFVVISGSGLFLRTSLSSFLLFPWIAGYLLLVFAVSYHALFSKERLNTFPFIVLGVLQLNFLVQTTGGIHSSLWPAYFLFAVLVAAFSPPLRTAATAALILVIESANLLLSGEAGIWMIFGGFALSLVAVSATTSFIMTRARREAQRVKEDHAQLIAHADAYDPLAGHAELEQLTAEARQASNVKAARQRDDAFDGLIEMIYGFVPAHTYALFLKEPLRGTSVFALRARRSLAEDSCLAPLGTRLDPGNDHGIIEGCIRDGQPQYFANLDHTPGNLGYYARPVSIKSLFADPIRSQDEVVGILVVDSLETGAFSLETQDLFSRFAPFFVQLIEKIRLAQELDLRARNFAGLHKMSAVMNSSLDLGTIFEKLAMELAVLAPHDICLVVRYDEKTKDAHVIHQSGAVTLTRNDGSLLDTLAEAIRLPGSGRNGQENDLRFPIAESAVLSRMLNQAEQCDTTPYHFHNLGERDWDKGFFSRALKLTEQLGSLSCWPLVTGDKFIGAFFLGALQPDAFSEYNRSFLDTLMNQFAVVMDNMILHQQVQNMALTDGLTGLLNHRTFMEKMDEEVRRLNRAEELHFSLLLLDIDLFKKVNDEYGHPVGDVALKTISGVIHEMARSIDFVARYGGEEFAVGLVGADDEGAYKMAERIRKAVEATAITAGKITLKRTLSIGVASYSSRCAKREELISQADQALYHAKHNGRNRVCRYGELNADEADRARAHAQK